MPSFEKNNREKFIDSVGFYIYNLNHKPNDNHFTFEQDYYWRITFKLAI